MADNESRRTVIDRANRMLRQSRTLRKVSDELLQESNDIKVAAKDIKTKKPARRRVRR